MGSSNMVEPLKFTGADFSQIVLETSDFLYKLLGELFEQISSWMDKVPARLDK